MDMANVNSVKRPWNTAKFKLIVEQRCFNLGANLWMPSKDDLKAGGFSQLKGVLGITKKEGVWRY